MLTHLNKRQDKQVSFIVLNNSDLILNVLAFIDPQYERFSYIDNHNDKENDENSRNCSYNYCTLMLLTFKNAYWLLYKDDNKQVQVISSRRLYVISLSLCKWSIGMGIESKDDSICSIVCRSNNFPMLLIVINHYNCNWQPCRSDILKTIENGDLDQFEWLYKRYGHINSSNSLEFCCEAAKNGHLHVLQWLRSQDPYCPLDDRACSSAAFNGHLHALQWLRSQDTPCPWNECTCSNAAGNGVFIIIYKVFI